jgi:potassium efflux system protein
LVPEHENVLKNPAPLIIFLGFGESSLDFRVLFWTHFEVGLSTKSAVGVAIDEAFKKEGIEIPFPQRDLHLRSISENVSFQNPPSRTKKPSTSKTKTGPQKK